MHVPLEKRIKKTTKQQQQWPKIFHYAQYSSCHSIGIYSIQSQHTITMSVSNFSGPDRIINFVTLIERYLLDIHCCSGCSFWICANILFIPFSCASIQTHMNCWGKFSAVFLSHFLENILFLFCLQMSMRNEIIVITMWHSQILSAWNKLNCHCIYLSMIVVLWMFIADLRIPNFLLTITQLCKFGRMTVAHTS